MVVLNKIIRKSVSLLARVLVVYVTPTYFFLLCSASQCNKRHHNYEQVFVANQQSESSKRSSSTTEEDASAASQVAVDQVERALKQARDQELIAGLEATLRSQDATPLGNISATEEIEETYSDSQDSSPKVSQAEVSDGGGTLTQEQPEATLRTQKATPLEKSIPSMEETDSDSQDSSPKVLQAEVNDVGGTLMQEEIQKQIEQLTETLITQEETLLERNIPSIKKPGSNPQDSLPKVSQAEVNDNVSGTLMQEQIEQLKSALLRTPEVVPPLENIIMHYFRDDETVSLLGEASARTRHLSTEGNNTPRDKDLIKNLGAWQEIKRSSSNLHQDDEKSINNVIRLLSDGEKID